MDTPEKPLLPDKWNYQLFKDYLLSLTRGKEFLLPYDQFPREIQLNNELHEQLKLMRRQSRDGKERWALIGFKDDRRTLYTNAIPAIGNTGEIPGEVALAEVQKAKKNLGIVGLVGDVHSHPNAWWRKIYDLGNIFPNLVGGDLQGFSPGDLFHMLMPEEFTPMMIVVESGLNIMALRSKETEVVPPYTLGFTQEKFESYWVQRMGGRMIQFGSYHGILALDPHCNPWSVTQAIGQRHKLALYAGNGKDLIRVTPDLKLAF